MASNEENLTKINKIIEETIRPALQRDGGDLKVIDFKDNNLRISFQGACGGCPHAKMGTLTAIEGVLKEQYGPDITVEMV